MMRWRRDRGAAPLDRHGAREAEAAPPAEAGRARRRRAGRWPRGVHHHAVLRQRDVSGRRRRPAQRVSTGDSGRIVHVSDAARVVHRLQRRRVRAVHRPRGPQRLPVSRLDRSVLDVVRRGLRDHAAGVSVSDRLSRDARHHRRKLHRRERDQERIRKHGRTSDRMAVRSRDTPEDQWAAKTAQEYGAFIHTVPWYQFPFGARLACALERDADVGAAARCASGSGGRR